MSERKPEVVTYRNMIAADLHDVLAIETAVHAHPWTRGNFADSLDSGYDCWVAVRGSEIVAYAVLMNAAGEAHLLNVSVAAAWQRRGIGSALTRHVAVLARDRGAAKLFLEVRPSNSAARELYAREGFREVGLRRGYYPDGDVREDAIVMELALT